MNLCLAISSRQLDKIYEARIWALDKTQHRNLIPERMKTNEMSVRIILALCLEVLSNCSTGRGAAQEENGSLTKKTEIRILEG